MELSIIQSKIYEIRGYKVMLDFDLAGIYRIETRRLNEAVKRNMKRFPPDFMFQLTNQEFNNLMSQFATSSWGGTRKLPYAFTELGATMLSSVLNSDVAIEASILVVRAFVTVRQLVLNPPTDRVNVLETKMKELEQYIENVFADYDNINEDTRMQLELVNETLAELQNKSKALNKPHNPVGFNAPQYKNEKKKTEKVNFLTPCPLGIPLFHLTPNPSPAPFAFGIFPTGEKKRKKVFEGKVRQSYLYVLTSLFFWVVPFCKGDSAKHRGFNAGKTCSINRTRRSLVWAGLFWFFP